MPSRAWVVTLFIDYTNNHLAVSMPSRAWVVTSRDPPLPVLWMFQCPLGLELLLNIDSIRIEAKTFQCPLGLELLHFAVGMYFGVYMFQCPLGLELLLDKIEDTMGLTSFQCPLGLELLPEGQTAGLLGICFNALSGLSCYPHWDQQRVRSG